MFVIQVTPLIRGTKLESLSYFSGIDYPIGSFVEVPVRGKKRNSIVVESHLASSTKTALKAATFSLRKLPNQTDLFTLPESIRETASEVAKKYPVSIGATLFALLPPDIRNGTRSYPRSNSIKQNEESTPQILTAKTDERYIAYQGLIRSTFAHKGSIMVVVPTSIEVSTVAKKLSLGIEDRLVVFSPNQTKRQRDLSYKKFSDQKNTKLIIATTSHAYLERDDLMTIIVEQSASSHYVTRHKPYLDHREVLIAYAKKTGRSIILGDTVPRTEDEVRRRDEIYLTHSEEAKRIAFTASLSTIKQKDKPKPDLPFQLFSNELKISVERALEGRGHVFFYTARRGLAPVIACIDCGYIFRCPDSNTPYSLIRMMKNEKEERWFVSSTSGRRVRASDVCANCGSWRLRERGIGIQQVHDEWVSLYPDTDVTIIDNTTATTTKQATKLADSFFAKRSGLLIGTQMALPFLSKGVDVSAVISLDAARAIPTWRADESLFRLLIKLRELTSKEVFVQTRSDVDNLIIHASRGALERFYDDEIALRKMLHYPPYYTFVLLTWVGTQLATAKAEEAVSFILENFQVEYYNDQNSTPDKIQRHGLIRVSSEDKRIYESLIERLRSLPHYVKVEINPERIV
ncbi:hypothetical protein KC865_02965 [Candidatus Kaiserbacteria bacterium]|nr:hypothetical protein [Candidatus Kaiserbacteria bacterium]